MVKIDFIYYFQISHKEYLVFIVKNYNTVNTLSEDLFIIQCKTQDELFYPNTLHLQTIIRSKENFHLINPFDEFSFTKYEFEAFIKSNQQLYGKNTYILPTLIELRSFTPNLTDEEVLKLSRHFPAYQPLINPYCCWQRHNFFISRNQVSEQLLSIIVNFSKTKKINNCLIYGRYWGSGKTGMMYWIIAQCVKLNIPFIYRSEFWKDDQGYYKNDDEGLNEPHVVTEWLLNQLQILPDPSSVIIFLDEVVFQPHPFLQNNLIITVSKEIPQFVKDGNYTIYDLMVDFPFTIGELNTLITNLMSTETRNIFPKYLLEKIVKKHHKWRFPASIKDPAVAIRVASYALASALHRKLNNPDESILVNDEDITYWLAIADSPYINHYPQIHDVHAEYFVFDGQVYTSVDPHYKFPLPE